MAWVKTQTVPLVPSGEGRLEFTNWLFQTYLPTRGWTNDWTEGGTGSVDTFYSLKRTYTTQTGATLDCSVVYEMEPGTNDLNLFSWNGTDVYADWVSGGILLWSDSNWKITYDPGDIDVWEDEDSDGFLLYKKSSAPGGPFGFQLPDGGYLDMPMNSTSVADTRPLYWIAPVMEQNMTGIFMNTSSTQHYLCSTETTRPYPVYDVWQDYSAVGATNNTVLAVYKFWEDLSQEWKMQSHALDRSFSVPSVVKIDAKYYLNVGQWLLPAGTTEPSI